VERKGNEERGEGGERGGGEGGQEREGKRERTRESARERGVCVCVCDDPSTRVT